MKVSKHITELAKKLHEQDAKEARFPTSVECYEETLTNLKFALLNGRYYTSVESVAASGMSRVIKIAYIKNNRLHQVHDSQILRLAGCDKNGRISGCGMDMLFSAQYDLFHALCPKHRYQSAMKQYNSY